MTSHGPGRKIGLTSPRASTPRARSPHDARKSAVAPTRLPNARRRGSAGPRRPHSIISGTVGSRGVLIEPPYFFRGSSAGSTYVIPDGPKPWTWTTVSSFDPATCVVLALAIKKPPCGNDLL